MQKSMSKTSCQLEHVHLKQTKCPLPFCSEPRLCPGLYGAPLAMLRILVSWQPHKLGSNKHQVVAVSSSILVFLGFVSRRAVCLHALAWIAYLLAPLLAGFCAPGASPTDFFVFFGFSGTCLLTGTNLRFEQRHLHISLQRCLKLSLAFPLWRVPMVQRCRLFREEFEYSRVYSTTRSMAIRVMVSIFAKWSGWINRHVR